ncbi:4Fe-4S binding protein [Gemmatimonadota bacterium]
MPTTSTSPVRRYFSNIVKGVSTTLSAFGTATRHIAKPTFTVQYPRQKAELPDRTRHRLHVVIEDCIGCLQCERACPVECIKIEAIKAPKGFLGNASAGNPINFFLPSFTIDMAKCCYCGLCTMPCPTECIVMTANYEFSSHDITDHVYQFSQMSAGDKAEMERVLEEEKQKQIEEAKKKAAEKAAAAAAEKTEDAGSEEPPAEAAPGAESKEEPGSPADAGGEA